MTTKACACCHAVCKLDLRTCPLCGEGSWLELDEKEVELALQLTHTVIDEECELLGNRRKPGRPKKRRVVNNGS